MKSNQSKPKLSRIGFHSILICFLASSLSFIGCSTDDHKQSADDLREKTAEATAELKRDTKSVAEGVKEGWNRDKERVDLNSCDQGTTRWNRADSRSERSRH